MALTKAIEYYFLGAIMSIVLLTFLAGTIPTAQETIDNAPAGAFAMGEASKLMLGLLGFTFVAGVLWSGTKEMLAGEDRTRVDGYPR